MTLAENTEYGIGKATSVSKLRDMWFLLKSRDLLDKCSIRVFEGHLYSLMDDDEYYEESGNRKLINVLLYEWDHIRNFALKDEREQGWGSRIIRRNEYEQTTIDELCVQFQQTLWELIRRELPED